MDDRGTAFVISVGHGIDQSVYADTVSGFEEAGLPVTLEQREPEFFASLQYLAPTALVAYLCKPYTEKFLSKLAEDNYDSCKAGLKALWSKVAAKDRQLRWVATGTKGKVSDQSLLSEISFLARTSDGQAFRLLFPNDVSKEQFGDAVRDFYTLVAQHDRDLEGSPLGKQPPFQTSGTQQRVLTLGQGSHDLVEVDVVGTARRGSLVTASVGPPQQGR